MLDLSTARHSLDAKGMEIYNAMVAQEKHWAEETALVATGRVEVLGTAAKGREPRRRLVLVTAPQLAPTNAMRKAREALRDHVRAAGANPSTASRSAGPIALVTPRGCETLPWWGESNHTTMAAAAQLAVALETPAEAIVVSVNEAWSSPSWVGARLVERCVAALEALGSDRVMLEAARQFRGDAMRDLERRVGLDAARLINDELDRSGAGPLVTAAHAIAAADRAAKRLAADLELLKALDPDRHVLRRRTGRTVKCVAHFRGGAQRQFTVPHVLVAPAAAPDIPVIPARPQRPRVPPTPIARILSYAVYERQRPPRDTAVLDETEP